MNQSEFGDTPVSRCRFYRQVCGLPAIIDPPELGRIVVRAGIVWALMMPAHLGQLVKIDLQRRGHGIGPIMSHPRSHRWSYLVRPDLPDYDRLFAEMFRLDVSVVRVGGEIALPSPTDKCARFRHWIRVSEHERKLRTTVVCSLQLRFEAAAAAVRLDVNARQGFAQPFRQH